MKINRWVCAAAAVLVFAAGVSAQEFWEKKPYTEWNKDQVKKLLQDSPWAAHSGARDVENLAFTGQSTGGQDAERRIDYYAQIRSALPIRQAVIRRAMIEGKYDKLPAEQKKAFDEGAAQFMARPYSDEIVIVVEYSSNIEVVERELARHWQGFPSGTAPANTYLTGHNGIRVAPIRFQADAGAGRSFQIAFPRVVDGQPVVTPETKALRLEFPAPIFGTKGQASDSSRGLVESRAFFEFKTQKMNYKGDLVF